MLNDSAEDIKLHHTIHMLIKTVMKGLIKKDNRIQYIMDDLTSVGFVAGIETLRKSYDPNHKSGARFSTYAYYRIRGAILNELRRQNKHFNTRLFGDVLVTPDDGDEDRPEDIHNAKMNCSAFDGVIPVDLDRYEKFVIQWRSMDYRRPVMRKKLKNLHSKRSLEDIEGSIMVKVIEANRNNQ